ncbi:MAG: hypothetical protein ABSB25_08920 [Sedimentisphaerales bacterium]|jgi:hypothetical protein
MNSRKPKTFSSPKEVFKSYFPNTMDDKKSASEDRYGHIDCDFPKRLANNFRSSLEGKRGR